MSNPNKERWLVYSRSNRRWNHATGAWVPEAKTLIRVETLPHLAPMWCRRPNYSTCRVFHSRKRAVRYARRAAGCLRPVFVEFACGHYK